jgi:YD repeat-containing protein
MTESIDRLGRAIKYQYDADNRLTTQIWLDSGGTPTATFTYSFDANGNQTTAGNATGTFTLQYDALNRVTGVQDIWTQRLTFAYDGVGNRTRVQDSLSGTTTSVYDAANNLVTQLFGGPSQTAMRVDLTYNGDNQIAALTRYSDLAATTNVAYSTYTYDVVSRLTNLQTRKGSDNSNILNLTYTYDPASNVKTEVATARPPAMPTTRPTS